MPETAISTQQLEGLLLSRDFYVAVFEVANITIELEEEAGFVVYMRDSEDLVISDLAHGNTNIDTMADAITPGIEFGHLILNSLGKVRNDIAFMLHSHPDSSDDFIPEEALKSVEAYQAFTSRTGDFADAHKRNLFPSTQDTELYSNVNKSNPGHVSSIIVTHRDFADSSMLFFRHATPDAPVVDSKEGLLNSAAIRYDVDIRQYEGKEPMLKAMKNKGYGLVEVDLGTTLELPPDKIGSLLLRLF